MTHPVAPGAAPGAVGGGANPGPGAFLALDLGTATTTAALVAPIGGHRRLLLGTAVPAGADLDELAAILVARVRDADPELAEVLDLAAPGAAAPGAAATGAAGLPRLTATGGAPLRAAVLAATEATRAALEADAAAAGWLTTGASAERDDALAAMRVATRPDVAALVLGTADPPSTDERDLAGELAALGAAVAERRPDLPIVLVGAAAARRSDFPLASEVIPVPRPHGDAATDLRAILAARRAGPGDARQALAAVAGTLAEVLALRVELLEIGIGGATRVRAEPPAAPGDPAVVAAVEVPTAALAFDDDAALDRVEGWSTLAIDRARLRDRLAELRLAPWSDLAGDGALLRGAALRASLERLVGATDGELGGPAPDLVVLAGGAWSSVPAPAALHALADGLRRPGVVQVVLDAARLLAPLGTADDGARRALVADLVPDALVPLGTLAIARGVRGSRQAGNLRLAAGDAPVELELAAGRLALVDLPPGAAGEATLSFRSAADLGVRGRRFAVRVTGGLAGFVVDLRDVPLRLPERSDARRDLLGRWEAALWPERDR